MRLLLAAAFTLAAHSQIGQELAITYHLADGEEFRASTQQLFTHGRLLFNANWTDQEGGGRPKTKGTGRSLSEALVSKGIHYGTLTLTKTGLWDISKVEGLPRQPALHHVEQPAHARHPPLAPGRQRRFDQRVH